MLVVVGISIACWLAAIIATFTHCLPVQRNWQILPDPGFECSAGLTQNIVIATGNVLVDALLIVVPVQTMRDLLMPAWRRTSITFLLSLGVFVMAMTIARCILSVDQSPNVAQSSVWVFSRGAHHHHRGQRTGPHASRATRLLEPRRYQ